MMKLTFTDAARQRIDRYRGPAKKVLLDYDDGVGPFSAVGTCSLDNGYQLIFVDKGLKTVDYDVQIDSNIGPIFIKGESIAQFEDEMEVRFNKHLFTLPLVSRKGILTENVELLDYSNGHLPDQQMTNHDC